MPPSPASVCNLISRSLLHYHLTVVKLNFDGDFAGLEGEKILSAYLIKPLKRCRPHFIQFSKTSADVCCFFGTNVLFEHTLRPVTGRPDLITLPTRANIGRPDLLKWFDLLFLSLSKLAGGNMCKKCYMNRLVTFRHWSSALFLEVKAPCYERGQLLLKC